MIFGVCMEISVGSVRYDTNSLHKITRRYLISDSDTLCILSSKTASSSVLDVLRTFFISSVEVQGVENGCPRTQCTIWEASRDSDLLEDGNISVELLSLSDEMYLCQRSQIPSVLKGNKRKTCVQKHYNSHVQPRKTWSCKSVDFETVVCVCACV